MTKDQIQIYEVSKKDLEQLKRWKTSLPFGNQNHGCGSRDPNIYFQLEKIHSAMYKSVIEAIEKAEREITEIIDKL